MLREGAKFLEGEVEELRESCGRYLVRLEGVVPESAPLRLRPGAIVTERDPRAITIVAHGPCEHLEAELDAALPVAGIERMPASLKDAFACLTEPMPTEDDGAEPRPSRGSA